MLEIKEAGIRFKIDSANIELNLPTALDGLAIPRWKKIFRILRDGCWDEAIETLRDYLPMWEEACQSAYDAYPSGDKKTSYIKAQKLHKAFKEYFK